MVPDTVQLMVEVAGLCSRAPALEVMRPAGMAPWRRAHRNFSYHCSRFSGILHVRQGPRHALPGVVHGLVQDGAVLGLKAVLLVPDIGRGFLYGYLGHGVVAAVLSTVFM